MGNETSQDQTLCDSMKKSDEIILKDHGTVMMDTIDFRNNRICKAIDKTGRIIVVKTTPKKLCIDNGLPYPPTEIELLKKLQHPGIVQLYSAIVLDDFAYMFMEYLPGGDFVTFMQEENYGLDEYHAKMFWLQMARPIQYLHGRNICHRDIKAENFVLVGGFSGFVGGGGRRDGKGGANVWNRVEEYYKGVSDHENVGNQGNPTNQEPRPSVCLKLIDFEYACEFSEGKTLDRYCGSFDYASPELIQGILYHGPDVDVWALGVIFYIMLTKFIPFNNQYRLFDRDYRWPASPKVSDFAKYFVGKIFVEPDDRPSVDVLLSLMDGVVVEEGKGKGLVASSSL